MSRMVGPNTSTTTTREGAPDWRESARCVNRDPELFWPKGKGAPAAAQSAKARAVCRGCPVIAQCKAFAAEIDAREGVWAGEDFGDRDMAELPPHGSVAGYRAHRKLGIRPCPKCMRAWNADAAARAARNRGPATDTTVDLRLILAGVPAEVDEAVVARLIAGHGGEHRRAERLAAVAQLREAGRSITEIAKKLGKQPRSITRDLADLREQGALELGVAA